ncbi:MAG TPA: hypothetical protein VHC22_21295 [Pirellulales bacterium]|nr:hypothetical protein [Pirellulales bacterium]
MSRTFPPKGHWKKNDLAQSPDAASRLEEEWRIEECRRAGRPGYQAARLCFQFRSQTLLWLTLCVACFMAGLLLGRAPTHRIQQVAVPPDGTVQVMPNPATAPERSR